MLQVGPLKDGGAHRVHAGGPGLERGEQDMPNEFNVWTREAGAGSLAISVEGPSKAEIDFKDRKDGSCYVSYVVSEPGELKLLLVDIFFFFTFQPLFSFVQSLSLKGDSLHKI